MPLSDSAVKRILGLHGHIDLDVNAMARSLTVTFFPIRGHVTSAKIEAFAERLRSALRNLGVTVVDYEAALAHPPFYFWPRRYAKALLNNLLYFFRRVFKLPETRPYITLALLGQVRRGPKIKRGIAVIASGEGQAGNLPMDNMMSFSHGNVVTILDMPAGIDENSDFETHFSTALKLFAYHVTNIVIGVGEKKWILYNFNASHPSYPLDEPLESHLLQSLIPKLAAPIRPPRLKEFRITGVFDVYDPEHKRFIDDLLEGGAIFQGTGLYPAGKKISELPFRNELYYWMGQIHLDDRSGMSYGFLARQLPVEIQAPLDPDALNFARRKISEQGEDYFIADRAIYVRVATPKGEAWFRVPPVWVLTLRSGANKTNPNPDHDIVKMGLDDGNLVLETPSGLKLNRDYKPSFDTKVILAHAVGNALFAAVARFALGHSRFADELERNGMAISHWHGYLNPEHVPRGWYVHGMNNPTVSCSSPQSAVYALRGKEAVFAEALSKNRIYHGDIHIEPQHGTNITFFSLRELAEFLGGDRERAGIGNAFLERYR